MTTDEQKKYKREYMREYMKNNPEARAKVANYRKKRREDGTDTIKEWREKNKDHITNYNRRKWLEQKRSLEGRFSMMQQYSKAQDKVAKRIIDNPITTDEIRELYDLQEGKCMYTGVDLAVDGPYQISLDRIDSTKGHTRDNCQLVILPINRMKSNMTHDQFLDLIRNIQENAGVEYTAPDYKSIPTKAKEKIHMLMTDLRRRSELAKKECEINLDTFKEWRITQNDRCSLSGVPVTWEPKKWNTGSIDRIDSSKGYTLDNIQLVIWPINMMKNDLNCRDAANIVNLML